MTNLPAFQPSIGTVQSLMAIIHDAVPAWSFFLLSHVNGSAAGAADEHFRISFSRENAGTVSIICQAGEAWQTLGRVSWHNLEGLNFTRSNPETLAITTEPIPARNSGVSALEW